MTGLGKCKLLTMVLTIALISVATLPVCSQGDTTVSSTQPISMNNEFDQSQNNESTIIHANSLYNLSDASPINSPTPSPLPRSTPQPATYLIENQRLADSTNSNTNDYTNTEISKTTDNSKEIQSALASLGPNGGQIILSSDATLSSADILITSNIILSGVNPNITIHLDSKRLNVAKNAVNVTIKDLILDASNLGNRNAFVVYAGAQNVSIQNITIQNDPAKNNALLTQGNQVEINNLTFINVPDSHPIQIAGSHTYVKNCHSNEQSLYALVSVAGGITDIHIEENVAENRPLFDGGYTTASSTDIWVLNNTLINFPKQTYGILVMGGTAELKAPFDKVFITGNTIRAGISGFNAIAVYGLSSNIIVANNTIDQTLSAHNAIGVASGVNVTVTQNTVFGCIEGAEGGIEVESNPVHNRFTGISENVNVTNNIIYGSQWGIYVRIMVPDHINWNGNPLKSKNILIEGNTISNCTIGINLLNGDGIIVKDNILIDNTETFSVDKSNVLNYTIACNANNSNWEP